MTQTQLTKILEKLESIEERLAAIEKCTATELHQLHSSLETLAVKQEEDITDTLLHLDAKLTAVLEAQKLNFEMLRVFSTDPIQH